MDPLVPAEHDTLVANEPGYRMGCSIYKTPTPIEGSTFGMDNSGKACKIHPHKVQRLQEMFETGMYVIDYLNKNVNATHKKNRLDIQVNLLYCKRTVLKMLLISVSDLPNNGTSSHHLFGKLNLRSMIIRASSPEAFVPWLQI